EEGTLTTLPVIERSWTDYGQGTIIGTGNQADVAISGRGFFIADAPGGPVYTRNGGFTLSIAGRLETREGYPVRSRDGNSIQLDGMQPFEIDRSGVVRQHGQVVSQLAVVDFDSFEALGKQGSTYFRLLSEGAKPVPAVKAEVLQGRLEHANSTPVESAVR